LAKDTTAGLRVYVVWTPMSGGEERHVPDATPTSSDRRSRHYWDGENYLGLAYQERFDLQGPAWDVFFLFERDATWEGGEVPKPSYWMHQLRGVTQAPRLDASIFAAEAARLER
jgi:hypothetical protein